MAGIYLGPFKKLSEYFPCPKSKFIEYFLRWNSSSDLKSTIRGHSDLIRMRNDGKKLLTLFVFCKLNSHISTRVENAFSIKKHCNLERGGLGFELSCVGQQILVYRLYVKFWETSITGTSRDTTRATVAQTSLIYDAIKLEWVPGHRGGHTVPCSYSCTDGLSSENPIHSCWLSAQSSVERQEGVTKPMKDGLPLFLWSLYGFPYSTSHNCPVWPLWLIPATAVWIGTRDLVSRSPGSGGPCWEVRNYVEGTERTMLCCCH